MNSDSEELRQVRLKLAQLNLEFLQFVKASNDAMSQIVKAVVDSTKIAVEASKVTNHASGTTSDIVVQLLKRMSVLESTVQSLDKRRVELRRKGKA